LGANDAPAALSKKLFRNLAVSGKKRNRSSALSISTLRKPPMVFHESLSGGALGSAGGTLVA
jgi:hypothetical protein